MYEQLLRYENKMGNFAGLKSGRLHSGLKAGEGECRGGTSPL